MSGGGVGVGEGGTGVAVAEGVVVAVEVGEAPVVRAGDGSTVCVAGVPEGEHAVMRRTARMPSCRRFSGPNPITVPEGGGSNR